MKAVDWLTCEETIRRLDDYLDRALSEREEREVGSHLEVCEACARAYGIQERLIQEVRGKLNRIHAPASLRQRVAAALREVREGGGEGTEEGSEEDTEGGGGA